MKLATLKDLWVQYSREWFEEAEIEISGDMIPVSAFCSIKDDYEKILLKRYNAMKDTVKEFYFGSNVKHVNRYKRAAIIAYVISSAEPLIYKIAAPYNVDDYFLKQRLAFYVAIGSIVQDFPENEVEQLPEPLFDFTTLGFLDADGTGKGNTVQDDFRMSIYKDLFFSEIYQNFNVLTMANVFGLLTEKASKLSEIKPDKPERD